MTNKKENDTVLVCVPIDVYDYIKGKIEEDYDVFDVIYELVKVGTETGEWRDDVADWTYENQELFIESFLKYPKIHCISHEALYVDMHDADKHCITVNDLEDDK